jgi:hypothetical protein
VLYRGVYNQPTFAVEFWLRLSASSVGTPSTVLTSSDLRDVLYNPSNGYAVFIDPCGNLSAWLGSGNSTLAYSPGARLTEALTKSCVSYKLDVAHAAFPWKVVSYQVPLHVWTHLAVMYSSGLGVLALYVNGAAVATVSGSFGFFTNTFADLEVGRSGQPEIVSQNVRSFSGAVDELAVFTLVLPSWYLQARTRYGLASQDIALINTRTLGISTGCSLQGSWAPLQLQSNCLVVLSGDKSPVLVQLTPETASVGDVVTVSGSNLGSLLTVELLLNGLSVPVLSCNGSILQFSLPDLGGYRGTVDVSVHVSGLGRAVGSLTLVSQIVVTAISPSVSSVGGGLSITLTGKGFSTLSDVMKVFVGSLFALPPTSDLPCILNAQVAVTSTSVSCTTAESREGFYNIKVLTSSNGVSSPPSAFVCKVAGGCSVEFALRRTPVISSFSPLVVTEGTVVSVFGTGCAVCNFASCSMQTTLKFFSVSSPAGSLRSPGP